MLIKCLDCGREIGCYFQTLRVEVGSIECSMARYYGICQKNATNISSGLCDKCFDKAMARRKKRDFG